MKTLRESYLYAIYCAVSNWLGQKWESSLFITWLTGQDPQRSCCAVLQSPIRAVRSLWVRLCRLMGLPRLLQGSIFLHPAVFCSAAAILAPVLPTIVSIFLICAALFSLVLSFGADREKVLRATPLNAYVALYAFVYSYATLTSASFRGSLFPGLLTILFVLSFYCAADFRWNAAQVRRLICAMALVGVAISFYGFYQFLFPHLFRNVWTDQDMFSSISFRVYSTLENPNVLGEYFLLVIPLACALLFTAKDWKGVLFWLAACGIMGICLILTYSRGCYLGLLAAAAVFLVLLDKRFILLGIVAIALCPFYLPESVLSRFTSIGDLADTSTSYRVSIWLGTISMLRDYWFCGIGPGIDAFNVVYPHYAHNSVTAPHSHNLYLQITCDSGVCGIFLFLAMMVAFYRMMFTAIKREQDRCARVFQIAGTSAITGFLVQSMTDYTFYNYRVMLLFWITLGLSVLFTRMGRQKEVSQ